MPKDKKYKSYTPQYGNPYASGKLEYGEGRGGEPPPVSERELLDSLIRRPRRDLPPGSRVVLNPSKVQEVGPYFEIGQGTIEPRRTFDNTFGKGEMLPPERTPGAGIGGALSGLREEAEYRRNQSTFGKGAYPDMSGAGEGLTDKEADLLEYLLKKSGIQ